MKGIWYATRASRRPPAIGVGLSPRTETDNFPAPAVSIFGVNASACALRIANLNRKQKMRLFLYSYSDKENFAITRKSGLIGAQCNQYSSRVRKLKVADMVLIRDSSVKRVCRILGYGVVVGMVFDQSDDVTQTLFPNLLWPDESRNRKMIYRYRVPISFYMTPDNPIDVAWSALFDLEIRGSIGRRMRDKPQLAAFFRGNFITEQSLVRSMLDVFDIACLGGDAYCRKLAQ